MPTPSSAHGPAITVKGRSLPMVRSATWTCFILAGYLFSEDGRGERNHQIDACKDNESQDRVFECAGIGGFFAFHRFHRDCQIADLPRGFDAGLFHLLQGRLHHHVPRGEVRLRDLEPCGQFGERVFTLRHIRHLVLQQDQLLLVNLKHAAGPVHPALVRACVVQKAGQFDPLFDDLSFQIADLCAEACNDSFGVQRGPFDLQPHEVFLRGAPLGFGPFKACARVGHLVVAFLGREVVHPVLGIVDQLARKVGRDARVSSGDLHPDHAFGRVIANFDVFLVDLIGLFIGGIGAEPLDRVDPILGEMRLEAHIPIQTQHCIFGLQETLHRDTVRIGRKLRGQQAAKRSGTAGPLVLDDQEFGFRGIHRRRDDVEIIAREESRQHHKKRQPDQQKAGFLAAATADIALNVADFFGAALCGADLC
mmetsp:Transcript_28862/g.54976  ORF Transcript_28862/g.54976 Transcript_28862/m.54976 type:complete len:422 (+) Transcript_28862:2134-3399(+)